jgi:hypothetical protein
MSEDPIDDRLAALVTRLDELTGSGRIHWELADDTRDDSFTYATPTGAVELFSRDRDGRDPYVVVVRDTDGRLVERVEVGKDADLFELVTRLYRLARRQALRADAVIEALLSSLE